MDFKLLEMLHGFSYLKGDSKFDDDFVDRINRHWTSMSMVFFAIILSASQMVGDPIKCWPPQEFKKPWVEYAEDYCWVQNTYFVPTKENIPKDPMQKKNQEIIYYQWVPYVLCIQGLMYYIPAMIWRLFNWKSGLDLADIVKQSESITGTAIEERTPTIMSVSHRIGNNMIRRMKGETNSGSSCLYLTMLSRLYLFCKLLYAVNAVGQFFLINYFLGGGPFGVFQLINHFLFDVEWHESGHFPRTTMCDFSVRKLGQPTHYTIQCVLTINIFTEKIFVFIALWVLFVAFLTIINTLSWLVALLIPWQRHSFIRKYLPLLETDSNKTEYEQEEFIEKCVGMDGVLVYQLLSQNSDDIVTQSIVKETWEMFQQDKNNRNLGDKQNEEHLKTPSTMSHTSLYDMKTMSKRGPPNIPSAPVAS